jgi:uncharacterized OsmC-like protein
MLRPLDSHGSLSRCKQAEILPDIDQAGNPKACNPAELLLAAGSACMIKSIERITPLISFSLRDVEVRVDGVLIEVPVMLLVVKIVNLSKGGYESATP